MEIKLSDQLVVITGGAKGIGRGICLEMAKAGTNIFIIDQDAVFGHETQTFCQNLGVQAFYYNLDITQFDQYDQLFTHLQTIAPINIWINNAGITTSQSFLQTSVKDIKQTFDINFFAAFELAKRAAQNMINHHICGNILFTTSTHDDIPFLSPSYSTSKAALAMLVKELSLELTSQFGIRVNAVAPGVVAIHGQSDLSSDIVPLGKLAVPEDIGQSMVFLASNQASHITGHTLVVDGAFSHAHTHYWLQSQNKI